ncbi:MAG TPA: hypothetical protein VIK56_12650 [Rhodoferax sp.]
MRTDALYALVLLRQGAPLASADRGHGRGGDADHSAQPVGEVARASPMLMGVIKNFPSGVPLADWYAAVADMGLLKMLARYPTFTPVAWPTAIRCRFRGSLHPPSTNKSHSLACHLMTAAALIPAIHNVNLMVLHGKMNVACQGPFDDVTSSHKPKSPRQDVLRKRRGAVICAMTAIERVSQSPITTFDARSGSTTAVLAPWRFDFSSDLMFLKFNMGLYPDGHFKIPHLWPVKFPQAGRLNYQLFGLAGSDFLSW